MEHTTLVTPRELEEFSDRRDSEALIPELVARLVNLSVPDLTLCRIPYGDAIRLPGLDGMVQTNGGFRQYVPKGASYWEIGSGGDAQKKATDDYRKRTQKTSDKERATTTFVFVTSRSRDWSQSDQAEWIRRRRTQGWKEIKVIDGVQLCEWLREFPSIGKWLLQRIGLTKVVTGFQTPAEHWSHLALMVGKDDPPLPPQVFLVGRETACEQLERLFRDEIKQIILSIESENDAEDFVAAFLESLDEPARRAYGGRCLFISDADAWHAFSNLRFSHVLVASPRLDLADSNEQLHLAARAHNHGIVFSISGAWAHGTENLVPIMSPSRSLLEKTLVDGGFFRERASELASAGAQNLAALKRFLRGLGELPPYATWDNARFLAQASLIGRWRGDSNADREALEDFLGKSYGEWIETVRADTLRSDTPLVQRNEAWKVISRGESWSALGSRITDEDLERFEVLAVCVLGENDPRFDLSKEDRFTASIHGVELVHSRLLREGVAESLALLGTREKALSSVSQGKAQGAARLVVRRLLDDADWRRWASLNHEIPLLAEAAPTEFLDAVEAAVADPPSSPFIDVFRQEGDAGGIVGGNYMTGVLWALETLAWNPDLLARATLLLGDLAAMDPGGSWSNRPRNSLIDIYLPWHVQTLADLSARRAALESLAREHPDVAWRVLMSLLPSQHGVTTGTRKPVWRRYIPSSWKETVTRADYQAQVEVYASMCTQMAAQQLEKLAELIDQLPNLPPAAVTQVLSHLESDTITSLPEIERLPLWEALIDLLSKHRKFADAPWVMPEGRMKAIENVANRLTPASYELFNRRLFTERDWDLYEDKSNFDEQARELDNRRQHVMEELLRRHSIDEVILFAQKVESPRKVGHALGAIDDSRIDNFLLPDFLQRGNKVREQLLASFIWRRFSLREWQWADQELSHEWEEGQNLEFLLSLPPGEETWRRVEAILPSQVANYWNRVQINAWWLEPDELLEAVNKLSEHGQAASAVDCLYLLSKKKIPVELPLAMSALIRVLESDHQQDRLDQHHIIEVISWLQQNAPPTSDDLAQIEWRYLPILNRLYGGVPKVLEQKLASSPAFFCDIITAVFRSENEDDNPSAEISDSQKQIAKNAYSLLHGWRILPGTTLDGAFDGDQFLRWLDEVKARCRESGHFGIAMDQLGQALAFAPEDPSGLWLHKSIATALDARDVSEMRKGFSIGLFNKRGVHSFSHGEDERGLATDYRAKADALINAGFPRVGDEVRQIAEEYEREAESESQRDVFDDR